MAVAASLGYRQGQRQLPAAPPLPGLSKGQVEALRDLIPGMPPQPANENAGMPRSPARGAPLEGPRPGPVGRLPVPANLPRVPLGALGRAVGAIATKANPYLRAWQMGEALGQLLGALVMPIIYGKAQPEVPAQAEVPAGWDFSGWTTVYNCGPKSVGPGILARGSACNTLGASTIAEWNTNLSNGIAKSGTTWWAVFYSQAIPHPAAPTTHIQWRNSFAASLAAANNPNEPLAPDPSTPAIPAVPYALPVPATEPAHWPRPLPAWLPAVMPELLPIVGPAPAVQPVPWRIAPYRRPNPNRNPLEQPVRGPVPGVAPGINPSPRPEPAPAPRPATGSAISHPGRGRPRPIGPTHRRQPPTGRMRERKFFMRSGGTWWGALLNLATESADFIKAAYWAIEPEARKAWWRENANGKRHLTPIQMFNAVWANLDKINGEKFLKNLLDEATGDAIFGSANKGISDNLRNYDPIPGLPPPTWGPAL